VSEPLDAQRRRSLERLVREAAWLREAKEASRPAPVNLTALQVLALLRLDSETSFEAARNHLHIKKANLSRALKELDDAGLIEASQGRYRDQLPRPSEAGIALLDAFLAGLRHRD
jgi:DNA-binding MarR family transcriptional regulator